jgi:hypothetical protein
VINRNKAGGGSRLESDTFYLACFSLCCLRDNQFDVVCCSAR